MTSKIIGVVVLIVFGVALLSGCGSDGDNGSPTPEANEEAEETRPGNAAVYADIETMSCGELQETFDRNMER